jgi:hypothetical protein
MKPKHWPTKIKECVIACGCNSPQDVANVLMKLISMSGLTMCATISQDEVCARRQGVAKPQYEGSWKKQVIN